MKNYDDLIEKYRHLFEGEEIRRDPRLSCMSFGIECGIGWYDHIEKLMEEISNLKDEAFVFTQIKEKFGILTVYYMSSKDEVDEVVRRYEEESFNICENCGKPGKINDAGWYSVRCDECRKL